MAVTSITQFVAQFPNRGEYEGDDTLDPDEVIGGWLLEEPDDSPLTLYLDKLKDHRYRLGLWEDGVLAEFGEATMASHAWKLQADLVGYRLTGHLAHPYEKS